MRLDNIKPKAGAVKARKRLGRGNGSGHGTFSGRGCKGQGQRKSGNVRPGFEGGQTPLIRRMPKLKGFNNPTKVTYQAINLGALNVFDDGAEVNAVTLAEKGLITRKNLPVKILGDGKLEKKLTVKVHKVSASAKEKIKKAGGKVL